MEIRKAVVVAVLLMIAIIVGGSLVALTIFPSTFSAVFARLFPWLRPLSINQPTVLDDAHAIDFAPNAVCNWVNLDVGVHDAHRTNIAFIKFDLSLFGTKVTSITSAQLKLYYYTYDFGAGATTKYSVHRVSGDWNERTLTWNNKPSFDGDPTSTITKDPSVVGKWWVWDVTVDVKAFVLNDVPNYGWAIQSDGTVGSEVGLASSETQLYYPPVLSVEYAGELEPEPEPEPEPIFTHIFAVQDQCGNKLAGATITLTPDMVTHETQSLTTDETGKISTELVLDDYSTEVSFTKNGKTYKSSYNVVADRNQTATLIVNRMFYWLFEVAYDDQTRPHGELILESPNETLTISVVNGEGEAWLTDTSYSVAWRASPEVDLGTLTVTNDGKKTFTLQITVDPLTGETIVVGYTETTEVEDEIVQGEGEIEREVPLSIIIVVLIALIGVTVGAILIRKRKG